MLRKSPLHLERIASVIACLQPLSNCVATAIRNLHVLLLMANLGRHEEPCTRESRSRILPWTPALQRRRLFAAAVFRDGLPCSSLPLRRYLFIVGGRAVTKPQSSARTACIPSSSLNGRAPTKNSNGKLDQFWHDFPVHGRGGCLCMAKKGPIKLTLIEPLKNRHFTNDAVAGAIA